MGKGTNYNTFFKLLQKKYNILQQEINTIFEIGSRDALDGVTANNIFKPKVVHVFECNKTLLSTCKKNIRNHKNIFLCSLWPRRGWADVPFFI